MQDYPDSQDEMMLHMALDVGGVGLFEWNVANGSVRLSPALLAITGLRDFDGRYDTWLNCIYREDQVRLGYIIERVFAEQQRRWEGEFRINQPDGSEVKWIEMRSVVAYDEHGQARHVVGVGFDVTETKRAAARLSAFTDELDQAVKERTRELELEYEARKKAEEMLRQAQKMEAVGQLTGGVAHDFNNLLTVIMGGLEMIGRQIGTLPPSPTVGRIARGRDLAMEGIRRATTLTSRLLAFSRQQPLTPSIVDVNKLVGGVCELLRRSLGEAISLETVLAGGLWLVEADASQLENAIVNLAINARDAMPHGGKLTIETANCYLDKAYVAQLLEPVAEGQYVMIAVADTGFGMDEATVKQAFDPFFTTKEVGKGTGLGLSQVYGFLRQSAGHVKIYSEPGQGTTVKVYLRRSMAHGVEHAAAELPAGDSAIGSERILVVEDDAALRSYAVEILRELGYDVIEAANGAAALKALETLDVDLLFTDVIMPGGMNGRQLADEAVRRQPGLKVLFTTGYTRNAIVHHGRLDPDVNLIGKPFTYGELAARIRSLLDS